MTPEITRSIRVIPDLRAQGVLTSDHDLGGAMSQSPRAERGLPRLDASK